MAILDDMTLERKELGPEQEDKTLEKDSSKRADSDFEMIGFMDKELEKAKKSNKDDIDRIKEMRGDSKEPFLKELLHKISSKFKKPEVTKNDGAERSYNVRNVEIERVEELKNELRSVSDIKKYLYGEKGEGGLLNEYKGIKASYAYETSKLSEEIKKIDELQKNYDGLTEKLDKAYAADRDNPTEETRKEYDSLREERNTVLEDLKNLKKDINEKRTSLQEDYREKESAWLKQYNDLTKELKEAKREEFKQKIKNISDKLSEKYSNLIEPVRLSIAASSHSLVKAVRNIETFSLYGMSYSTLESWDLKENKNRAANIDKFNTGIANISKSILSLPKKAVVTIAGLVKATVDFTKGTVKVKDKEIPVGGKSGKSVDAATNELADKIGEVASEELKDKKIIEPPTEEELKIEEEIAKQRGDDECLYGERFKPIREYLSNIEDQLTQETSRLLDEIKPVDGSSVLYDVKVDIGLSQNLDVRLKKTDLGNGKYDVEFSVLDRDGKYKELIPAQKNVSAEDLFSSADFRRDITVGIATSEEFMLKRAGLYVSKNSNSLITDERIEIMDKISSLYDSYQNGIESKFIDVLGYQIGFAKDANGVGILEIRQNGNFVLNYPADLPANFGAAAGTIASLVSNDRSGNLEKSLQRLYLPKDKRLPDGITPEVLRSLTEDIASSYSIIEGHAIIEDSSLRQLVESRREQLETLGIKLTTRDFQDVDGNLYQEFVIFSKGKQVSGLTESNFRNTLLTTLYRDITTDVSTELSEELQKYFEMYINPIVDNPDLNRRAALEQVDELYNLNEIEDWFPGNGLDFNPSFKTLGVPVSYEGQTVYEIVRCESPSYNESRNQIIYTFDLHGLNYDESLFNGLITQEDRFSLDHETENGFIIIRLQL